MEIAPEAGPEHFDADAFEEDDDGVAADIRPSPPPAASPQPYRQRQVSQQGAPGTAGPTLTAPWAPAHKRRYNLYHQWYYTPDNHESEPRWWLLRSGLPFPSYHSNPTRNFPPRVSLIDGGKDPCEELRAPRIRLAPEELQAREAFLAVVQRKADEVSTPARISTLNLSYQCLGEEYQYEQMLSFLKINRGVVCLAITDNFLTDLHGLDLPYLRELFIARNNFLSFKDIPAIPTLRRLNADENFITNLDGLDRKKFPNLERISLKWNPVTEDKSFLTKLERALPGVRHG